MADSKNLLTELQRDDLDKAIAAVLEQQQVVKSERDELKERKLSLIALMHNCQQSQYEHGDYVIILQPTDSLKFSKKK